MKRIKKTTGAGTNYYDRLREYFGFHLEGLDVRDECGQTQVQVVYCDFKHIDTVRRELAQMMPEVEFVKIKREFTAEAELWALGEMMDCPSRHPEPTIYVKRDNGTLELTSLSEIARTELMQLELDDDDNIPYSEHTRSMRPDDALFTNANT